MRPRRADRRSRRILSARVDLPVRRILQMRRVRPMLRVARRAPPVLPMRRVDRLALPRPPVRVDRRALRMRLAPARRRMRARPRAERIRRWRRTSGRADTAARPRWTRPPRRMQVGPVRPTRPHRPTQVPRWAERMHPHRPTLPAGPTHPHPPTRLVGRRMRGQAPARRPRRSMPPPVRMRRWNRPSRLAPCRMPARLRRMRRRPRMPRLSRLSRTRRRRRMPRLRRMLPRAVRRQILLR